MKTKRIIITRLRLLLAFSTLLILSINTSIAQNNNPFSRSQNGNGNRDDHEVTLLHPNGGQTFRAGYSSLTISWSDNYYADGFDLDLYKGGYLNSAIATNVSGNSYFWQVPSNLAAGTDYDVRIRDHNDFSVYDFSDDPFTILEACSITVTSPNGGESWLLGSNHEITWTHNASGTVEISLYKNNTFYTTITNNTPNDGSYMWSISNYLPFRDDYRIIIISNTYNGCMDLSDDDFSLETEPFITVTEPNGGETYDWSDGMTINWNDNIAENVRIDLFKDNFLNQTIVSSTASDGHYEWDIPDDITGGADYSVKVTSVSNGSINDFSDGHFTINPRELTVTSPNGGESWFRVDIYSITWNDNISENVKIELFKNGSLNLTIASSTLSDGNFLWTIPSSQTLSNDYKIKISSTYDATFFDFSDADFTITSLTVTSPNGGEDWESISEHEITWDDNSSSTEVKIELFIKDSFYSTIISSTANDGSFYWDADEENGVQYKIKITAIDGPKAYDFSDDYFTISDPITYNLTVTSPNGGENWLEGNTHNITWSDNLPDNVKILLYKGTSFVATITASTPSNGSYSWSIPTTLEPGTNYKVRISGVTNFGTWDLSNQYFTISANAPPTYEVIQDIIIANGETQCFNATNTITVAGSGTTVNINSGGEVIFIAGNKIVFNPGFHSHPGSYSYAYITTTGNYCSNPLPPGAPNAEIIEEKSSDIQYLVKDNDPDIRIYPNPTSGHFTIDFMGEETTADIQVLNFQGKKIRGLDCRSQTQAEININYLPTGMYIVIIKTDMEIIKKKIIKIK